MKITVNEDTKLVSEIRQKLEENDYYCPCRIVKSEDTKCMCKEFREQKTNGFCHCQLFYKTVEKGENNNGN